MNRINLFVLSTAAAGVAAATLVVDWSQFWELPTTSLWGLAVMVLFGVAAERLSVSMVVGGTGNSTNSVAYLPLLATVLLFGPAAGILFLTVAHLVGDFLIWKKESIKGFFNVAQHVLSGALGGIAFYQLGGAAAAQRGLVMRPEVEFSWIPLLAFGVVYLGANHALVARVVSLAIGAPFLVVWRQVMGKGGSNLFYDVLVSPVAIAIALMGMHLGVGGLVMAGLPLLAIRNAHLGQFRLQQANRDLLSALVKAIETRDPYTSGHSMRVADLAELTAQAMGLSQKAVEEIQQSALVHDVGKIDAVYTEILRKPDQLTDAEREIIESHVTKGVELLETMSSVSKSVIQNVLHHHERWDGRGYPYQLAGQDIPLGARVINVCDAIDAMLSDRPYRSALDLETVRKELDRYSGIQFDPGVVRAVVSSDILERYVSSDEAKAARGGHSAVRESPETDANIRIMAI